MTIFLARAYKEFDLPEIETVDPPAIRIDDTQAVILESIKASGSGLAIGDTAATSWAAPKQQTP